MELEEDPAKSLNIIMELEEAKSLNIRKSPDEHPEEDPAKSLNIRKSRAALSCASHLGFSLGGESGYHKPLDCLS